MFPFIAFLYISVASLKFVKGTEVFYATSSDALVQNSSCIVDDEVLHPCVTHWMYSSVIIPSYLLQTIASTKYMRNIIFLQTYAYFFSNLSTVEIRPWRQNKQASLNYEGDFTIECTNVHELMCSPLNSVNVAS